MEIHGQVMLEDDQENQMFVYLKEIITKQTLNDGMTTQGLAFLDKVEKNYNKYKEDSLSLEESEDRYGFVKEMLQPKQLRELIKYLEK